MKGKTISKAKKELKEEEGGGPGNGTVAFPFYLPPETLCLPAGGPPGGGQHHYILNDLKVIYASIFFFVSVVRFCEPFLLFVCPPPEPPSHKQPIIHQLAAEH